MRSNRGKNTSPELKLRGALRKIGLSGYRLHWKGAPGHPDIAFPRFKVAIFVNGDFWHSCPKCALPLPKTHTDFWKAKLERNVMRDQEKRSILEAEGWKVFVFWEHEIKADVDQCAVMVKTFIDDRQVK